MGFGGEGVDTNGWVVYFEDVVEMRRRRRRLKSADLLIVTEMAVVMVVQMA